MTSATEGVVLALRAERGVCVCVEKRRKKGKKEGGREKEGKEGQERGKRKRRKKRKGEEGKKRKEKEKIGSQKVVILGRVPSRGSRSGKSC